MSIPTKATLKLANGNMGHAQGIGFILCCFTNCLILYPVGAFFIFQVTLPTASHQVSSNFMLGFKRLHLNLLNIVNF